MSDTRALSGPEDVEPLGLGSPVDAEAALGTEFSRVAPGGPRVLVDLLAQIRVLLG